MNEMNLFEKAESLGRSLVSRYLATSERQEKVSAEAKAIRFMSCHGSTGHLSPCEHRIESVNFPGSHHCKACGCGDRKGVLLDGDTPPYEKLDYPYLVCPIHMPGFSNYTPSYEEQEKNLRKVSIEKQFGPGNLAQLASEQKKFFKAQQLKKGIKKVMSALMKKIK